MSIEGVKYIAEECPIQGFKKGVELTELEANIKRQTEAPTPKAKVASSWRTNLKHRLKYGAAADFAATDEDMEAVRHTLRHTMSCLQMYILVFRCNSV